MGVVDKVRRSVVGSQGKQKPVLFRVGPVVIFGDSVGRNRILEAQAVGIALQHGLQKCPVHHVHFLLAFPVSEVHPFSAHNGPLSGHVSRNLQIHKNMGKRRLGAPAAGRVHAENEGFHAFLDLVVGQVVRLHKGRKVCIKGRKGLGGRPFVLHDAQKVDHLVAQGGQVLGRGGCDLPGDAA